MAFLGLWLRKGQSEGAKSPPQSLHEPILAYRAWRIAEGNLLSCTCDCVWQPRMRMNASCNHNAVHARVPAWDCQCGLYAFKTDRSLAESGYAREPNVAGRVALWGHVIDHDLGYRAEHAYPQVLYLRGGRPDELIRRLCECYAIECVPRQSVPN